MRNVLFVHNGAPGRFAFIAQALRERGWQGILINGPTGTDLPGMITAKWNAPIEAASKGLAVHTEKSIARGMHAAEAAADLKRRGFVPDLIIGHPAWGEMMFLRQVYPDAPQIQLGEFFFRTTGTHFGFDPEFPTTALRAAMREHLANGPNVLSHADADRIVTPTHFQASTFPAIYRPIMEVIHEGIDTAVARPQDDVRLTLNNGVVLARPGPIVTFINRRFEPMRGFHIFMRALPALMRAVPDVRIVIVGRDEPDTYGPAHASGSWKTALLAEVGDRIDPARLHFVGAVDYPNLVKILSISAAHVHFSYPTVLSWSLMDAMACGCLVLGSRTASVAEVLKDRENGLLLDFFDVAGLSAAMIEACRDPARFRPLREAARETIVTRYDRATIATPAWLKLIDALVPG